MITLYELQAKDPRLAFSPYAWRTKMCLKHKGLDFDRKTIFFRDKDTIAPANSKTIPVINDNGTWVADSFDIAKYLDDTYSDKPTLMGGKPGRAAAAFYNNWSTMALAVPMFKILVKDIFDLLDEDDQTYFRSTREPRLGMTLEETVDHRSENLKRLEGNLIPLEMTLSGQNFLGGDAPNYLDYAVFGFFQWARLTSNIELYKADSAIAAYVDRMLDLYDGYARNAVGLNSL